MGKVIVFCDKLTDQRPLVSIDFSNLKIRTETNWVTVTSCFFFMILLFMEKKNKQKSLKTNKLYMNTILIQEKWFQCKTFKCKNTRKLTNRHLH